MKLVGRVIRFLSKSKFAHTFVWIWNDPTLGPTVYEAADNGVTVNFADSVGYLDPEQYLVKVYEVIATDERINDGLLKIRRFNGRMYGYFQLLGFAFVYIWLFITGRKVNNPITGGIICSELVIIYLKAVFPDEEWIQKADRNTTAPEDIYEFAKSRPDLFDEVPLGDG